MKNSSSMATVRYGFKADDLVKKSDLTREDILLLKLWQTSTPYPKLTDEQIALFLISCKNNGELAKQTIKIYFEIKLNSPEIFQNRNVLNENLKNIAKVIGIAVMPKYYQGSAILILYVKDANYGNFDLRSHAQHSTMTLESMLFENPPESVTVIFDAKHFTFMHLTKLKPKILKNLAEFNEKGNPLGIREAFIINTNYITYATLKLVKQLVRSDIIENIKACKSGIDFNWFHKTYIPKEYLPREYGGDLESMEFYHERNIRKLRVLQPFFEEIERQVYG